jgi:hydrogenase small subunit
MPSRHQSGNATIAGHLRRCGFSRRKFLDFCVQLMVAAPAGLALTDQATAETVAKKIGKAKRLPVVWLHFQDCTGCSETLLRTSHPDVGELILHLISLEYHETLMAGSGKQAEESLHQAVKAGGYVLVVEGSIPTKGVNGAYMKIGGKPAIDMLKECAANSAAIIAMGSCSSWGGVPSADPNPTGAVGVDDIIKDKPIINIPGCPPNPYTLMGVVLQYATAKTLPALDDKKRPKFAFDRNIHDHCPRRPHFDGGRFAVQFGDEGHRQGWCLYKLGCKGPDTHAGCSTRHFNEVPDAWPIGIGHPCFGCTEKHLAFKKPMFEVIPIYNAKPPEVYAPISAAKGSASPFAAGAIGLAAGAFLGGGYVVATKLAELRGSDVVTDDKPESEKGAEL